MKYLKTFENYNENQPISKKILALLDDSFDTGWYGSNMDEAFECARLENRWLDLFHKEYCSDEEAENIFKKIQANLTRLWEDNLEDAFECAITEDIHSNDDEDMDYTGWVEDITKYLENK
jgi:hypothetical protein